MSELASGRLIGDVAAPRTRGTQSSRSERRHAFRVRLEGRASLFRDDQLLGHHRLRDLCIRGCALVGRARCKPGEQVDLVLHLPKQRPLWLRATVLRMETEYTVLRFAPPHARVEDRLQDLVVSAYAREAVRERFSLVVEPNASTRRSLVRALDELGAPAVGVATPLDAVQLLLERADFVDMAFVGSRSSTAEFELLEFLARHYAHVRRVLTGDASALRAAWIAQATGDVHALLETPAREDELAALVQRLAALPREFTPRTPAESL